MRASYYDGRTATRHEVDVALAGGRVVVTGATLRRDETLGSVVVSEPLAHVPRTLTFADGALCELAEDAELERALAQSGVVDGQVQRLQRSWPMVLSCLFLLLTLGAAAYVVGLPAFATYLAGRMPASVASRLSEQMMEAADKQFLQPSKLPESRQAELQRRLDDLRQPDGAQRLHRPLAFRAAPAIGPNAFTLPDGSIVVLDELLTLADSDEQILAVLCHEAGHARRQHGLRMLLQDAVLSAVMFAWIGDINGLVAAVQTATLRARYSREFEREADAYAVATLKANQLSPALLAAMLEKLSAQAHEPKDDEASAKVLGYLSTHPSTQERIAALKREATTP